MNDMTRNVAFSQLPMPEGWFAIAQRILPLLENPKESGFQTGTELLSALAASRKLTPRALMKQVDAAKFLLETYPNLVLSLGVEGGHSQVEFLAKIHKMDRVTADRCAPDVLTGKTSMSSIRLRYELVCKQIGEGQLSPAIQARRRAINFRDTCYRLIQRDPGRIGARDASEIVRDYRVNRFTLDAAVVRDGQAICGVEFIVGGVASAARDAAPIVARLALWRYRVETMWIFLPDWATRLAMTIGEEASAWGIDCFNIATVLETGEEPHLQALEV